MCLALEQYRVAMRRNALNYDSTGCVYIMSQPDERLHPISA